MPWLNEPLFTRGMLNIHTELATLQFSIIFTLTLYFPNLLLLWRLVVMLAEIAGGWWVISFYSLSLSGGSGGDGCWFWCWAGCLRGVTEVHRDGLRVPSDYSVRQRIFHFEISHTPKRGLKVKPYGFAEHTLPVTIQSLHPSEQQNVCYLSLSCACVCMLTCLWGGWLMVGRV